MQIASRIYATEAAAIAALKTASPLFVSKDKESGADRLSPSGMPGDRQRFDIVLTPLTEPVEGTIPGPKLPDGSDGPPLKAPDRRTGEFQVDIYWQGDDAPALAGGRAADAPATAFEPPALPEPDVPSVPTFVSLFQGRTIMRRMGLPSGGTLFDAVDAYVEAHKADNSALYDAWNYSNGFDRNGAMVKTLAPAFGLTDAQLDTLFTQAAAVHA